MAKVPVSTKRLCNDVTQKSRVLFKKQCTLKHNTLNRRKLEDEPKTTNDKCIGLDDKTLNERLLIK